MGAEKTRGGAGKAARGGADAAQTAVNAGQDMFQKAVQAGADAFVKGYDQYVQVTKEQIDKVFPSASGPFDEFAAFGKDNFDAMLAASTAAAKGWEAWSQQLLACNQKAIESSVASTKALFGCRTVQDVVEVQTDLTRRSVDQWVADSSRLSELGVQVANQAVEPINARVAEAVDRFAKPAAV